MVNEMSNALLNLILFILPRFMATQAYLLHSFYHSEINQLLLSIVLLNLKLNVNVVDVNHRLIYHKMKNTSKMGNAEQVCYMPNYIDVQRFPLSNTTRHNKV